MPRTALSAPALDAAASAAHAQRTYHHGDLAAALVVAGVELARTGGPDAVVVREASRRAGVSHNAAYRHFADRDAFLEAVSVRCFGALAVAIEERIDAAPRRGRGVDRAWARLRGAGRGYVAFAVAEPGWFRTAFAIPPQDVAGAGDPVTAATTGEVDVVGGPGVGAAGLNPYELLARCLDDLVTAGALPAKRRAGAEIAAWSAVHGLATLLTDGPLRLLGEDDREALLLRVLDTVCGGL